MIKTNK